MPIYEYTCQACGRRAEVIQKVDDPPPAACVACGQGPMSRQVSRTSFQLKGGGWYADLYGSTPAKAADGAGKDGGATEGGGKDGGSKDGAGKAGGGKDAAAAAPAPKEGGGSDGAAKPASTAPAAAPSTGSAPKS